MEQVAKAAPIRPRRCRNYLCTCDSEADPRRKEDASVNHSCFRRAIIFGDSRDLACEQLAIVISSPSGLTYGELKLLPLWDPLRGDPRFEKIVGELAPKQAK